MKALRIALELLVLAGCFWLTNRFVEQVMVPDYTQALREAGYDWSEERMAVEHADIERKRTGGRILYFGLVLFAAAGYYLLKTASAEKRRWARGEVHPLQAKRMIVLYRFLGLFSILMFFFLWPMGMLMHGIVNIVPATGQLGLTYPFGQDEAGRHMFLFLCPLFFALGMGPGFMLRGIAPSSSVSMWIGLAMTVYLIMTSGILSLLKLSLWWNLLTGAASALIPDVRRQYMAIWHEIGRLIE